MGVREVWIVDPTSRSVSASAQAPPWSMHTTGEVTVLETPVVLAIS
jgi:hypothetical protein